jgi:hypothetical protein
MKTTMIILILVVSTTNLRTLNHGCVQPKTVESKNQKLEEDFQDYWINLGNALQQKDMAKLDEYLNSPVVFYGREDNDPIIKLFKEERIIKVLEIYRNGGFYVDEDKSISYEEFFRISNSFEKEYEVNSSIQEIQDFTFKKLNGSWKLISVYTNTK